MPTNNKPPVPPSIAALHEWWERQRGARPMPRRSELDPATLRQALPDLVIIDVAPGERAGTHVFTYRLAGTRVDERLGFSLKGRTVGPSLLGEAAATIQHQYETAVTERRPLLCNHTAVIGGSRYVEYQRLVAPLSGEDETKTVALVAAVDFTCAFLVDRGRPAFCHGAVSCDRADLCIPPAFAGRR